MQDRFRFRVWRPKNIFVNFWKPQYIYFPLEMGEYGIGFTETDIIEQCTGLKDKNGKLVYEGDIVRVIEQCMTNTLDRNYPMLFNEKTAKFGFKHPDGHFFYFTNNEDFSYEVIGNIHENADLLGEE